MTLPAFAAAQRHRRRLPYGNGNGGDCLRRKTPHRAPPCEELDPATILFFVSLTINDTDGNAVRCQACFCAENLHLFLGKSTKTATITAALFDSNMH